MLIRNPRPAFNRDDAKAMRVLHALLAKEQNELAHWRSVNKNAYRIALRAARNERGFMQAVLTN